MVISASQQQIYQQHDMSHGVSLGETSEPRSDLTAEADIHELLRRMDNEPDNDVLLRDIARGARSSRLRIIQELKNSLDKMLLKSTHRVLKTYFVKARDGSTVEMKFEAYFVPNLTCDFIGERAITNKLGYQVILDSD
jgi:hypothetical protein